MAWISRKGRTAKPEPSPSSEEMLLDLRDPLPPGPLEFGLPTRCPACEDFGYIDRLDLSGRVMQLHCPTCQNRWEISEAQIEAVKVGLVPEVLGTDGDDR